MHAKRRTFVYSRVLLVRRAKKLCLVVLSARGRQVSLLSSFAHAFFVFVRDVQWSVPRRMTVVMLSMILILLWVTHRHSILAIFLPPNPSRAPTLRRRRSFQLLITRTHTCVRLPPRRDRPTAGLKA